MVDEKGRKGSRARRDFPSNSSDPSALSEVKGKVEPSFDATLAQWSIH